MFFEQKVDRRSRKAMVEFLASHFRYDTMNSWNRMTSYAHCVKMHHLGLTAEQQDAAFKFLGADDNFWDDLQGDIADFTRSQDYRYTIGSNGRQNGYLVLYNSHREDPGWKSVCKTCGQLNYAKVAEMPADPAERAIAEEVVRSGRVWTDEIYLDQSAIRALDLPDDRKIELVRRFKRDMADCTVNNTCGRCRAIGAHGRVNLTKPRYNLVTAARGIDEDRDFEDWSMSALRDRVDLVCAFDRACDTIRESFIDMLDSCTVEEETIMVPKTVRRIACAESAA